MGKSWRKSNIPPLPLKYVIKLFPMWLSVAGYEAKIRMEQIPAGESLAWGVVIMITLLIFVNVGSDYVIVWLAMPYSSRHALHNRTQLRPHNIDERCPRHKHHGPAGEVGGLTIVPIIAMRHCQYVSSWVGFFSQPLNARYISLTRDEWGSKIAIPLLTCLFPIALFWLTLSITMR